MAEKTALDKWIETVIPVLESSLDAVAVVDSKNLIHYANSSMKTLLKLRPADLKTHKKFCDCITLSICANACRIETLITSGKSFRFDESPATLPTVPELTKLRILIRGAPIPENKSSKNIGAVITLRDTSAEVLVQAKYHKLARMVEERDETIQELRKLNAILRRKP